MSDQYLEPYEEIDKDSREYMRAIKTLMEELEATMFYQQRIAASEDDALKAIMEHNRDEEIEHCAMTIEWLRRKMPAWDNELRTYLFKEAPITELEDGEEESEEDSSDSLGIGDLK
ncbi:MAG: hypothetical protein Q4B52_04190 [Tissierellia bacterium]|nr:hypothetical protein [Tissierellia bacterium]